jgi:hypothetical protein
LVYAPLAWSRRGGESPEACMRDLESKDKSVVIKVRELRRLCECDLLVFASPAWPPRVWIMSRDLSEAAERRVEVAVRPLSPRRGRDGDGDNTLGQPLRFHIPLLHTFTHRCNRDGPAGAINHSRHLFTSPRNADAPTRHGRSEPPLRPSLVRHLPRQPRPVAARGVRPSRQEAQAVRRGAHWSPM